MENVARHKDARNGVQRIYDLSERGTSPRNQRRLAERVAKKLQQEDTRELEEKLNDSARLAAALNIIKGAKPQAGGFMICCPFHKDKHPSCSFRHGKDGLLYFHCFACEAHGDVLDLIKHTMGLRSFTNVIAHARELVAQMGPTNAKQDAFSKAPSCSDADFARIGDVLKKQSPVCTSEEVSSYLASRGVLTEAERDGWMAFPCGARDRMRLCEAVISVVGLNAWMGSGLASSGGGLSWSAHMLGIPWADDRGCITTIQRRLIAPANRDTETDAPEYVFPKGRQATSLYGSEAVSGAPGDTPVIIVEGAIDALSRRELDSIAGHQRIVLAIPSASSWRSEWASMARGRKVIVGVDADEAGDRVAAAAIARDVRKAGATRVVRLKPRGAKDWNEVLAAGVSS